MQDRYSLKKTKHENIHDMPADCHFFKNKHTTLKKKSVQLPFKFVFKSNMKIKSSISVLQNLVTDWLTYMQILVYVS